MAHAAFGSLLRYLHRFHDRSTAEATDGELLRRYVGGDEAAFAALLRRHAQMVWGVCHRLLDHEQDAEDAFQASFLLLLRKAESLRVPQSLAAFLHGVASRIARKARTAAQRRRRHEEQAEPASSSEPFAVVEQRELRALLDEELQGLPEKYRAPLVLCYLEGMSYRDAARQLGWRDGTVCGRLARARELLRRRLSRRGLALSGAALAALLTPEAAPAAAMSAVMRMATLFTLGQAAVSGAVSAPVAALAQGILHSMTVAKLKTISALVVTLGIFAAGAGLAASRLLTMKPAESETMADAQPDNAKPETADRTDLFGDPLPPGALVRMGTLRFRSRGFIGTVAFAPDGKVLAAGSSGGTILLYDPRTGRKPREIHAKSRSIPALAFAPDGKTLASIGSGTIQIWDTDTVKELRHFDAPVSDNHVYGFAHPAPIVYSHDGKMLASVAPGNSVHVWEVHNGNELAVLKGHRNRIQCLAFSPDDKTLFSADGEKHTDGSLRSWSLSSGKELKKFSLLGGGDERRAGTPLCFSPDGKTLVFAAHETWQSKMGRNIIVHREFVVSFLDLETGEVRRSKLEPQDEPFQSAVFSHDGKTIAAMNAVRRSVGQGFTSLGINRVSVYEAATGKKLFASPDYTDHFFDIQGPNILNFSPGGKKLAAATLAHSLRVWDLERNCAQLDNIAGHDDMVQRVVFSPDGRTVASAGSDSSIALWDASTGRQRLRLRGYGGTISSLAFSPDGKYLASASSAASVIDQTVCLWDTSNGQQLFRYEVPSVSIGNDATGPYVSVNSWVAFTAGGKNLAASGSDRKLRLWDVKSGKEIRNQTLSRLRTPPKVTRSELYQWPKQINDVVFTPDGRTMALCGGNIVSIVDVASAQPLFQFERIGFPAVIALSPDGKLLLHAAGKSCRLIEVASGMDLCKIALPEEVFGAAFSADARILAVSMGEAQATIHLFDVATSKELLVLRGCDSRIRSLAFSPDGTKLASGHWDTTALIWDVSAVRQKLPSRNRTATDLDRVWIDLHSVDAPKAHAALWDLIAVPDKAVPFLKDHLHPSPRISEEQLRRLIADLDADDFARREEASGKVAKLGIEAEPALRQSLEGKPSLEMRRRVEALLSDLACQTEMTPDALRQLRAIWVLEQIGSVGTRQILSALAHGAAAAPATRDAQAALQRLDRRACVR